MERFYIGAIMKDSIFDKEVTDMIIAKIKQDPTGKMAEVMQQIMDVCEEAGKRGFTMQELSVIATTGWFLSQSPELRGLLDNMMGLTPPTDNETWN
jgi:hypothetical protein|tara:strand:+ start:1418 stop:1705 length:288 start_codon:yes stop_codon:yes gene_type:complete